MARFFILGKYMNFVNCDSMTKARQRQVYIAATEYAHKLNVWERQQLAIWARDLKTPNGLHKSRWYFMRNLEETLKAAGKLDAGKPRQRKRKQQDVTFKDVHQERDKITLRKFSVHKRVSEMGRTHVFFNCPFCNHTVRGYIWSMRGCGKRCESCGALNDAQGNSYQWTTKVVGDD